MSVYIGAATKDDYSAMRGPCPEGFHVGTKSEWELIINSGVAFAAWNTTGGANFSTYLKMPAGGYRTGEGASVSGSNDMGYYWTCTQYNSTYNTYSNYGLYFRNSNGLSGISVSTRNGCIGAMIRGIKDVPVEPDSSWTTLISSGEDGIYHNATLGLISMVYSGFVYTIADKNVGATTVYNFNDTMSEANCGKFFQMGNNYQFPYSGTLTTSSTQVNASNYGPGNYYSSSTFITGSSGWDSSQNKDLWGGETGVQQTPKELKSAYIGEYVTPARLPAEYQEVEYIQSTGIQYLNIGQVFDYTTNSFEMYISPLENSGTKRYIGGYSGSSSSMVGGAVGSNSSAFYLLNNTRETTSSYSAISTDTDYYLYVRMSDAAASLSYGPLDGTLNTISVTSTNYHQTSRDIYVFCNNSGSATFPTSMKLYWLKMYSGYSKDTLIGEYIPCYRKSDNIIGVYDLVNDQFYTNAGSGTFTKGPDVTY